MPDKSKYSSLSERDMLVELMVRTEHVGDDHDRLGVLERDRWWIFTLVAGAWAGVLALFKLHG